MSVKSGPNILTTGLVFHYDSNDTNKSWRGKPTTNLTPDLGFTGLGQGLTFTYVGIEDGWKKYSIGGTWTGGTYPYCCAIDSYTFTASTYYSSSCYVKTNVPSKFANLFTGMNYVNVAMDNVGTSFSTTQADGSIYVGRSGFAYTPTTSQLGYLVSNPQVGQAFTATTDFLYIKSGQIELGTYPTPFVAGTRSNTQAIIDRAGNTITATNLTYASDNTFSFDGANNYLDVTGPGFTSGLTAYTFMHWSRRDVESRMPISSKGGPLFYQYGDNSWYYTHGGVAGEYYYPHAVSIPVGTYGFYCIVYNGSNVAIYRNGTLEGTQATTGTADWSNGLRIGNYYGSGYYYQGKIDSMSMYNVALTADQVKEIYYAKRGKYGLT
jgi:hypothetical protein